MMKKLVILIYFFLGFSFYSFGQGPLPLDSLFTFWINHPAPKPGVVISVLNKQEPIYSRTFGYANLEYNLPLTENSVFDLGSISKEFTGFAIAKLVLDDKLSMDEFVRPYFPELDKLDPNLKIKHLVYQTSGLVDVESIYTQGNYSCRWTAAEALKMLEDNPETHFPAGTRFDYSNTNYILLALIIEKITKTSFREWCHTNIFKPFNMLDTFIGDNPREIIRNRATAYYTDGTYFNFFQKNGMSLIGSSATYSTLADMTKWLTVFQTEEKFPEVFNLMKQTGSLDSGEAIEYGFGVFNRKNSRGIRMIYHLGGKIN